LSTFFSLSCTVHYFNWLTSSKTLIYIPIPIKFSKQILSAVTKICSINWQLYLKREFVMKFHLNCSMVVFRCNKVMNDIVYALTHVFTLYPTQNGVRERNWQKFHIISSFEKENVLWNAILKNECGVGGHYYSVHI
jgi:hypothetical protein